MDIRTLTPELSVAPQITPEDMAQLPSLGFRSVIVNRPDEEAGPALDSSAMEAAAAAAGLQIRYLPYYPGVLTQDLADAFEAAVAELPGPILAYCRSGTRSSHLWALSEAGKRPVEEIIALAAQAGYDLSGMSSLLHAKAQDA